MSRDSLRGFAHLGLLATLYRASLAPVSQFFGNGASFSLMISARTEQKKAGLIDDLAALARERLAPKHAEPAVRFVRQYYLGVAADDLAESQPLDLFGAE